MDADNTYQPYSGTEILRYLDGRMTSQEMRQLELAAMDDPFLEDAIEGFREAHANHSTDKLLTALQRAESYTAYTKQTAEKIIVPVLPIWRRRVFQMAVAALFVVGTGWYIFSITDNTSNSKTKKSEALVSIKADDSINIAQADTEVLPSDGYIAALKKADTQQKPIAAHELPQVSQYKTAEGNAEPAPPAGTPLPAQLASKDAGIETEVGRQMKDSVSPSLLAAAEQSLSAKKADKVVEETESLVVIPAAPTRSRMLSQQHLEDTKLQKISGKVVDGEKYPLDNITLRVKGRPGSTLSDELGRFEMVLADTNATLIASGPGYKTKEFTTSLAFSSNKKMELQLEPERSLEEEVVTGYFNSKKKALANAAAKPTALETDTTEASPVGGWDAFIKYVQQNKRFKDRPGSLSIAVVVNFEVDEEGKLGEFAIKKSGGDAYDKEAIRLLKEGPAWKIKIDGEEIGAVKVTLVL